MRFILLDDVDQLKQSRTQVAQINGWPVKSRSAILRFLLNFLRYHAEIHLFAPAAIDTGLVA